MSIPPLIFCVPMPFSNMCRKSSVSSPMLLRNGSAVERLDKLAFLAFDEETVMLVDGRFVMFAHIEGWTRRGRTIESVESVAFDFRGCPEVPNTQAESGQSPKEAANRSCNEGSWRNGISRSIPPNHLRISRLPNTLQSSAYSPPSSRSRYAPLWAFP